MTRTINSAGLDLIQKWEGCILKPYKDIAGVWTIGYGHTKGVTAGMLPITQDEAIARLFADIDPFEDTVSNMVTSPLTDNQFSALVALCFNVGTAPLHGTLGDFLNNGDYDKAADEFLRWDHVHINGQSVVSNGLLNRRREERDLFLS